MDKLFSLWTFDRDLLLRFSEQSTERLTGRSPMTFSASLTAAHLRQNVEKEVDKDRLIIEQAIAAFDAGRLVTVSDVDALFERTRDIDHNFVRQLVLPSVCIAIHYDDIEEARKRRILYLARLVEDLLMAWPPERTLPEAFRLRYSSGRFRDILAEYLELYCRETKQLANSIKFLPPFNRAMNMFMEELLETMEEVRLQVARYFADRIYTSSKSLPADKFLARNLP